MLNWADIQRRIWECEACRMQGRVAWKVRQQTQATENDVKLLLIGIAPPYVNNISEKTEARSATNDPVDNLRRLFILNTLGVPWIDLLARGLFLVHGVKCAIVPKERHQNPPNEIIDVCAPPGRSLMRFARLEWSFSEGPHFVQFSELRA